MVDRRDPARAPESTSDRRCGSIWRGRHGFAGFDSDRLSGTLNASGSATGLLSAPVVRLGLQGNGLAVRSVRDITLAADAAVEAGRLEVSALDLRSPLGAVHASGDVALADDGATSRLLLRWTDVDLDAAARSLGYELPTRLGSRGSGAADLRVPGSPAAAGALSALDADVSSSLRPGGGGLALRGAIDATVRRGAWSLGHRLASAPVGTSLEGTFRGRFDPRTDDSTIGGSTRLRIDDLGAVHAFARDAGVALPAHARRPAWTARGGGPRKRDSFAPGRPGHARRA